MLTVYSEFDRGAAAWLRELIAAGHLPPGRVDERDIRELKGADCGETTHLFGGIGGWPLALRLAGWADDRPVWTGSCPCQPFSSAGRGKGTGDARHLWPEMFRLIGECRPGTIFGEQVPGAIGFGWLDGVFADLEGEGYACGAVVLGAHSVGAPHIRQRLFWVANADRAGQRPGGRGVHGQEWHNAGRGGEARGLANAGGDERRTWRGRGAGQRGADELAGLRPVGGLGDPSGNDLGRHAGEAPGEEGSGERGRAFDGFGGVQPGRAGPTGGLGDTKRDRLQGGIDTLAGEGAPGERLRPADAGVGTGGLVHPEGNGRQQGRAESDGRDAGATGAHDAWSAFDLIPCRDGKARRVEPGTFPLAHGVSGRVGLLRGYGNAIVPQVAAAFIKAFLET